MDKKHLLWMDLEMTGLDPKKDRIVEVACIVTDYNFVEKATYEAVIHFPDEIVNPLFDANEWFLGTSQYDSLREHMKTGKKEEQVISELTTFIKKYFKKGGAVLAGNSIHQDRRFIRSWWPHVEELLHYRMLDVTSYKIIMENKYHIVVPKSDTHRALSDVRESIEELKVYIERMKHKDGVKN